MIHFLRHLRLFFWGNPERKRMEQAAQQKARSILRAIRRMNLVYERKNKELQIVTVHGVFLQDGKAFMPFNQLPRGIRVTRLIEDDLLQALRMEAEKTLQVEEWGGRTCFSFRVRGAEFPVKFSINSFDWAKAINTTLSVAQDPLPPLAFPVGLDADRQHIYADLEEVKHLLIAGTTGHGKSTIIHSMITTIIQRITPQEITFWLGDPKRTELSLYRPLMVRAGNGYVRRVETEPHKILEMLLDLSQELDRRQREQERVGAVNIQEYVRITGEIIPHIVLVIDEIADLITNREKTDQRQTIGAISETLLARIARQGRASGVHLVCATQHPESHVLTSQIKANMGTRVAFSTTDHWKSITILDDSCSVGIPPGRAFFRTETMQLRQVQTCMITPTQIKLIVDRTAKYGGGVGMVETERKRFLADATLLVEISVEKFGGEFAYKNLHKLLDGQIARDRILEIAVQLEKDNVLRAGQGKKPRKLYPLFQGPKRLELLESLYGNNTKTLSATPSDDACSRKDVVVAEGDWKETTPSMAKPIVVDGSR